MSTDTGLETIDGTTVRDAVRVLLDAPDATVGDWECSRLAYDTRNLVSGGLFRVRGRASANGATRDWSLIVKGVRSGETVEVAPGHVADDGDDTQPERIGNREREVLAYRSGLLDDLPAGLAAPRLLTVVELGPGSFQLWLEEIADPQPPTWEDSHYQHAARRLGLFNGAYLAGHPLPADPWLAYGWLPSWVHMVDAGYETSGRPLLRAAAPHPLFRDAFGPDIEERLDAYVQDIPWLLDILSRLPRTLCHRDAFPANLLFREDEVVAIDWACVGIGPVGEELAPLITQRVAGKDFRAVEAVVIPAYLDGLAGVGVEPADKVVRLGYAATAVLRYLVVAVGIPALYLLNPERAADLQEQRGKSIEQFVREEAEMVRYLLDLLDDARNLRSSLPI